MTGGALCAAGSDLLGQCSAALAAISIVFEKTDPSYALELLAHARDLYACAPIRTRLALALTCDHLREAVPSHMLLLLAHARTLHARPPMCLCLNRLRGCRIQPQGVCMPQECPVMQSIPITIPACHVRSAASALFLNLAELCCHLWQQKEKDLSSCL